MPYFDFEPLRSRLNLVEKYASLQTEYGCAEEVKKNAIELQNKLEDVEKKLRALKPDAALLAKEPDDYEAIQALCEGGNTFKPVDNLNERMAGAVLGRFAGCTLGVPVENWSIDRMEALAKYCGMAFPPEEYWREVDRVWEIQYGADTRDKYKHGSIDGVPADDDITYTVLGLLIIEKYGFDFTTADVGEYWKEYLPYACTAEDVALRNLKKGIDAYHAAEVDNPYCQWIGADIRADGFAFAAAGNPHLAATMGYRDAYLSHRRNGIYGEMFFAAVEAAAFTVGDPIDAVRIGLREIPKECTLHKDIEWALEAGPSITDFRAARDAVDRRFAGMSRVHTNNNACLTIFGLMLGKGDFSKTISNVVAMGLDNDCTGATAGSILGAIVGKSGIPEHWIKPFGDTVRTYIKDNAELSISDLVRRFTRLAENQPKG